MRKYNGNIIDKCSDLFPVHALSECDTVSYPYGKGTV